MDVQRCPVGGQEFQMGKATALWSMGALTLIRVTKRLI